MVVIVNYGDVLCQSLSFDSLQFSPNCQQQLFPFSGLGMFACDKMLLSCAHCMSFFEDLFKFLPIADYLNTSLALRFLPSIQVYMCIPDHMLGLGFLRIKFKAPAIFSPV